MPKGWPTMAGAEHEPITGIWGRSPQRGSGAEGIRGALKLKTCGPFHTKEGLEVKFVLPQPAPTFGQQTDIPPPQSATLGLHSVARKLLLIFPSR